MPANTGRVFRLFACVILGGAAVVGAAEGAPPAPLQGLVVDDRGQAVAGAQVVFSWWSGQKNQTVAAKSDEQGRFRLDAPPDMEGDVWPLGEIWAATRGRRLASERLFVDGEPPVDLRLVLPSAADVAVVVTGPDGEGVAGAQVTLPVAADPERNSRLVPEALHPFIEVTTDRAGRARIVALPRKELSVVRVVSTKFGSQSRYLTPPTDAEPPEIAISLRLAGRVRGQLIAPEPGVMEGCSVWVLSYPNDSNPAAGFTLAEATATSDKDGRFEIPAIGAGTIRHIVVVQKPGMSFLPELPAEVPVAVGRTAELTIPFKQAVRVRGMVREAVGGKPISDVMIGVNDGRSGSSSAPAVTGADGRFEFLRLPGPLQLYLQFSRPREIPGWFQHRTYQIEGGRKEVDLPPIELAQARGRVIDGSGRPVPDVKVEKVVAKFDFEGTQVENPAVWYTEPRELSTDAKGEFRAWVEVGSPYRVLLGVAGRAPQWTEWLAVAADAPAVFPDVVIGTLRSVAGRIVDRQNRPVPRATVFQSGDGPQRTEATSDDDGGFRLDGYQNDAAFLFAEKDGFRFHGEPLTLGDAEVRVVLTRTDEPPARRLATLAAADPAGEVALARRILQPALDGLGKVTDEQERSAVLRELAEIDPAAALERIQALALKGGRAEMLLVGIAKRLSAEDPDDAAALIESLDNAYSRAAAYVMATEALPASQRERRLEWIGKARLHLRGAGEPMMRTALTAYLARLMTESGDREEALKLITAIRPDVEKLPFDGQAAYVRGVAAEALASFDVTAALALIQDLKDDREYDRHHGNLARIVAPAHPAAAVGTLKQVRDDFQRDQYAVHVAPALATVDRAQADAAVALIGYLPMQAFAEGLMADALSKADPPAAVAQLERTYETLAKAASGDVPQKYGFQAAPVLAAWFLPVVEKLAPDRVEEFVFRALALRTPLSRQGDRAQPILLSRAYLAMFLARYDRELARGLYGDLPAEALENLDASEFSSVASGLFAAAAMIDPEWSVVQYEKLPADLPYNARNRIRGVLIGLLSQRDEARWRVASRELRMPMPWHPIE
ncbi:MAG TPA: carboxypeptidase-like regulatory domain-containing protein [Pirellulales bacterium]|nr:carboxypeptidase-like regulatory domain-containing protein [Pirellulales bacterium]